MGRRIVTAPAWPPLSAVLAIARPLVEWFEGFRAAPYADTGGIWTIGFGTTRYPHGERVAQGDPPCTREQATQWLEYHLCDTLDDLRPYVSRPPSAHQAAALLSLAYNVGVGAVGHSVLISRFNQGDLAAAAAQFLVWDKARVDGKIVTVAGLARRRAAEKALFETADPMPPAQVA